MKNIHLILTGLSLSIILLSINRLTPITSGYLEPHEFLRWFDFNSMVLIPLFFIILYYLLRYQIVYDSPFRKTNFFVALNIVLVAGIYFFGAGSGDHEVTNYLHYRFCYKDILDEKLCNIVVFHDDVLSNYIYYLGFVLMNMAIMFLEHYFPRKTNIAKKDHVFVALNSFITALGIFAFLALEVIAIDLWAFGFVMLLSLILLFYPKARVAKLPITFYFAVSYTLGVVSTFLYRFFSLSITQ